MVEHTLKSTQSRSSRVYNSGRGFAIIFNHVVFVDNKKYSDRIGTDKDVDALLKALPLLGIDREHIIVYDDKKYKEMRTIAKKLNDELDFEKFEYLMIFILSHGEENNHVMASDMSYDLFEFISFFTPDSMEEFVTKPKLFFIQACRGNSIDDGHKVVQIAGQVAFDQVDSSQNITYTHPNYADLLIAYSSHHGHYSFRNEHGSWFIQDLCNVIQDVDLNESDLLDILLMTNSKVAERSSVGETVKFHEKKQISSFYTTLIKKIYFKGARC